MDIVLNMYQEKRRNVYLDPFLPTITKRGSNKLVESDMALPAPGFVKLMNLRTG